MTLYLFKFNSLQTHFLKNSFYFQLISVLAHFYCQWLLNYWYFGYRYKIPNMVFFWKIHFA